MFLTNNPIDRFALSATISTMMASHKFHNAEVNKWDARIKKARKKAREYFDKLEHPAEQEWARKARFNDFIVKNRPDILQMIEALGIHYKEAEKQRITREMHLAHCYLKGRTYNQCERTCRERPNTSAIVKCIPKSNKPSIAFVQEFGLKTYIEMWLYDGNLTRKDIEEKEDQEQAIRIAEDAVECAEADLAAYRKKWGADLPRNDSYIADGAEKIARGKVCIRDAAKQRLDALKGLPATATA